MSDSGAWRWYHAGGKCSGDDGGKSGSSGHGTGRKGSFKGDYEQSVRHEWWWSSRDASSSWARSGSNNEGQRFGGDNWREDPSRRQDHGISDWKGGKGSKGASRDDDHSWTNSGRGERGYRGWPRDDGDSWTNRGHGDSWTNRGHGERRDFGGTDNWRRDASARQDGWDSDRNWHAAHHSSWHEQAHHEADTDGHRGSNGDSRGSVQEIIEISDDDDKYEDSFIVAGCSRYYARRRGGAAPSQSSQPRDVGGSRMAQRAVRDLLSKLVTSAARSSTGGISGGDTPTSVSVLSPIPGSTTLEHIDVNESGILTNEDGETGGSSSFCDFGTPEAGSPEPATTQQPACGLWAMSSGRKNRPGRRWLQYETEEGQKWWACEDNFRIFFMEESPEHWKKCCDPESRHYYWWNTQTNEYFFTSLKFAADDQLGRHGLEHPGGL